MFSLQKTVSKSKLTGNPTLVLVNLQHPAASSCTNLHTVIHRDNQEHSVAQKQQCPRGNVGSFGRSLSTTSLVIVRKKFSLRDPSEYGMVDTRTIPAPTRHLGANKEYASKHIYFIIKNHTLLSTTKCRVGADFSQHQPDIWG